MNSSSEDDQVAIQMPRYQSHKKVWALQIDKVSDAGEAWTLSFLDVGYGPRNVKREVLSRYMPTQGDYFVVYDDGYESISPKKAFEEGYTKL